MSYRLLYDINRIDIGGCTIPIPIERALNLHASITRLQYHGPSHACNIVTRLLPSTMRLPLACSEGGCYLGGLVAPRKCLKEKISGPLK